ncbi:MAG: hypothetical protein U0325_27835 [Polyangiales bacterium]
MRGGEPQRHALQGGGDVARGRVEDVVEQGVGTPRCGGVDLDMNLAWRLPVQARSLRRHMGARG